MQSEWTQDEIYLLIERGYALYQQGCYQEAGIIFAGVTAADPGNTYSRNALATVYIAMGESQNAIRELSLLLAQEPANEDLLARRCEAYCQAGNWAQASEDLAILRRIGTRQHVQRLSWRMQAAQASA
jgi:predicted Zn-dependent protease